MAQVVALDDDQRLWYEIRDTLLGLNGFIQNLKHALDLAAVCQHPDARWLRETLAGKDVSTKEDIICLLSLSEKDPRALCFAPVMRGNFRDSRLRQSADLGYAFAQARMCLFSQDEERFFFASQSASQGERDGYAELAWCYTLGDGCKKDFIKAKENFLMAAKLGSVNGMQCLGKMLNESDPQRWYWWGCAASRGCMSDLLNGFPKKLEEFRMINPSLAPVIFEIGRALKVHAKMQTWDIVVRRDFPDDRLNDLIGPVTEAIEFFTCQCRSARKAVDTWCLIARRMLNNQVNKDIRKKIGMLIWEARDQAEYPFPNKLMRMHDGLSFYVDWDL